MIEGWIWDAWLPGLSVSGLRGAEPEARADAEAWLRRHPGATVRLTAARLADGTRTWSAWWVRGEQRAPRRLRDGRIIWARLPRRQDPGADRPERAA